MRFAVIALAVLFLSVPVSAQEDAAWTADKQRLESLTHENGCEEYWDVLWPWAKKGNLEARAMLFSVMTPLPHIEAAVMPGSTDDLVTTMRHLTILAVHTSGYRNEEWLSIYRRFIATLYARATFAEASGGEEFLSCVENSPSEECARIAVEMRLVPSFEDYAKEIEAFTTQGMKVRCAPDSSND